MPAAQRTGRRNPFRLVSIPEHLVCQSVEPSAILLCQAAVKGSQVGLEIGESGRPRNGDDMLPFVQYPSQGNLRRGTSLLGGHVLDDLHQSEVGFDVFRLKPRLHLGPEIILLGGTIAG